jgi:Bacterial Ig-like domain (group 3)
VRRRRFGGFLGIAALAGFGLLAGLATPAQAATDNLYAAPAVAGTGDCSSPANACSIATAVTSANAKPVTDSVRIRLASGNYALSSPSPTALAITFAGPSLTLEAESATPVLSGTDSVRVLSVDAASNVTIDGLEIQHGATPALGGAIQNNGTLTIKRSTFSSNSGGNGGAIANVAGATLTVQDSTFADNTTTAVGGGAIINFATATIERSALIHNTAPINGGGINVQPSGTTTVTSSTIAGNTSTNLGGGISNLGMLTVQASTIANNAGSGGAAVATGNANVTFAADIIAAQSSGGACSPANTAIVDGGYNLDTDGTCISATSPATGSHNGTTAYGSSTYAAVLDAYLADALADNGGPTQTFALLNSPSPSTTLANPAFHVVPASFNLPVALGSTSKACSLPDQRGVTPVAGESCDIGAYLLQATKTTLVAPAATAGQPVTLTAKVTPAADAGTVSFDDGAGNPATAHCAAQPVTGGSATCTVAYATTGTYRVTASYSGDGAGNNYAPSTSASQTLDVAPAPPPSPPTPNPPILSCTGREITILDIRVVSGRATVRGLTLASHGGQKGTVRTGTKKLGTAKVAADGSFTATFKLPKTKHRTRLTAEVAGTKG